MLLRRLYKSDKDIEKRLVTGLIISDKVLSELSPYLQADIFELEVSKKVVDWILLYYNSYRQAPKSHIKDIFNAERHRLKSGLDEEVEQFLGKLSEDFLTEGGQESINEKFIIDRGKLYLKERHIRKSATDSIALLDIGKVEEAEKLVQERKKIIRSVTYNWVKPFDDPKYMSKVFEEKEEPLFRLKGGLGDLIGDLRPGWLFGVMGPMKRGKCIAAGSMIPLPNGELKKVEDVIKDEDPETLTLNCHGKIEVSKIKSYHRNGIKPVFLVKTRTGRELKVTDNDSLLTPTGWKYIKELKRHDPIAVPRNIPIFGGDSIPTYKLKILGYLLAEGNLSSLTFTNINPKIQDDFKSYIEEIGDDISPTTDPITVSIVNRGRTPGLKTKTRQWLLSIGVKNEKSNKKSIPKSILSLEKSQIKTLLSVMFTCDGSIYNSNNSKNQIGISYSSSSKKMIYQISHLLLRFGVVSKITQTEFGGKWYYEISIRDKNNIIKYIKEIGFLFEKQEKANGLMSILENKNGVRGFIDSVPPEICDKIRKMIPKQNRAFWSQKPLACLTQSQKKRNRIHTDVVKEIAKITKIGEIQQIADSDILWDSISSIEYEGLYPTFDLTIEKTHNFIANDIIIHNTFDLQDIALDAITSRKRVAFFSIEMDDTEMAGRQYKQVTAAGDEGGEYIYPCFDCCRNQDNTCNKPIRTNRASIPNEFNPLNPTAYQPCTACRGIGGSNSDFLATTWYFVAVRPKLTLQGVRKELDKFNRHFGANLLRMISFPAFSATMDDIEIALDELEEEESWTPHVIITDYAGRIKSKQHYNDPRYEVISVVQDHKSMAQRRNALVVTGFQSLGAGRAALNKDMQDESDIGINAYILADIDILMSLDQTPDEKEKGIWRMGVLEHRHKRFNKRRQAMCLQQLELGQPVLDTELVYWSRKDKKGEDEND